MSAAQVSALAAKLRAMAMNPPAVDPLYQAANRAVKKTQQEVGASGLARVRFNVRQNLRTVQVRLANLTRSAGTSGLPPRVVTYQTMNVLRRNLDRELNVAYREMRELTRRALK